MKVSANSIKPGAIIEHKSRLWVVAKTMHTKPGKGGAYIQAELKDIQSGSKLNERFRSTENIERVRLDEIQYQYLFTEGNLVTLMDQTTYEQITLNDSLFGDMLAFLQDGMIVTASFYEDKPISVTVPDTVIMTIIEAEPVVKGQTASSSYKPATLDNGLRIMVPPHIAEGTKVVVNTADCTYAERAKEQD
jgi:elongation factor P